MLPEEKEELERILGKVDAYRYFKGKNDLQCVVVESDWEEYEPTVNAILKRITKEKIK